MSKLQSSESLITDNRVNIHEFADVSPKAELGKGVTVGSGAVIAVSYTHLRAHETVLDLVCRLLLEKKKSVLQNVATAECFTIAT